MKTFDTKEDCVVLLKCDLDLYLIYSRPTGWGTELSFKYPNKEWTTYRHPNRKCFLMRKITREVTEEKRWKTVDAMMEDMFVELI